MLFLSFAAQWVGDRWCPMFPYLSGTEFHLAMQAKVPDDFFLAPDWTIEILSPTQKPNKVIGNILHCLHCSAQLGWFIDPDDLSLLVFLPNQSPAIIQGSDRVPMLPTIPLDLTASDIFSWLKMAV